MNRASGKWAIALVVPPVLVGPAGGALAQDNSIEAVMSPKVLSPDSLGGCVSHYTDIACRLVESIALTVNDTEMIPSATFADNVGGQLVVKCSTATISEMVGGGDATFDLTVTAQMGSPTPGTVPVHICQTMFRKPS